MATGERFGTIFDGGTTLGLGPAELLDRFRTRRDEAAFAALVARHGPMVLATCRRILPERADADDAFQATFLILARKAGAIADPDRLAPWLHGVARRVAMRSRSLAARRRAVEGERPEPQEAEAEALAATPPPDDLFDLRRVLDEELARLPAKYRAPLVLCYLEGLTHDEAAGQLRCPVGTVRSRLAGGRDRLRSRLARRGFDPGAAVLPPSLPLAVVSRPLQAQTVRLVLSAGLAATTSAAASSLARGVLNSMLLAKIQTCVLAAGAAALLLAGTAASVIARHPNPEPAGTSVPVVVAAEPPPQVPPRPAVPGPSDPPQIPKTAALTVSGRAVDPAGRPIAGARIDLISCASGALLRLAETRTDAAGAYRFADVLLPIRPDRGGDTDRRVEAAFELIGRAAGFGFAWVPEQHIRYADRILPPNVTADIVHDHKPGAPVILDLQFSPPATLAGRATDDRGNPLADAAVWIRGCSRPRLDQPFLTDEVAAFRGSDTIPPELNWRRTDADGRFAFDAMPPDLWVDLDIAPRGFAGQRVEVAITAQPELDWPDTIKPTRTSPIDLVFLAARDVPVRVVAGDTGRPLAGVFVQATGASSALSDADGRATLRAAPGEHQVALLPQFGTDYLETDATQFTVFADGAIPLVEATLRPAVVLEVTVTDADTGGPLAGVDLWEEGTHQRNKPSPDRELLFFRSFEAPNLVHSDRPKTDAAGKLRALAESGPRRVGVGLNTHPGDREATEPDGQAIDGKPGETFRLTFTMRRRR